MQAHSLEREDGVVGEPYQRRNHKGEIVSRESKFSKNIKVEDISRATYVIHDALRTSINHPHGDH